MDSRGAPRIRAGLPRSVRTGPRSPSRYVSASTREPAKRGGRAAQFVRGKGRAETASLAGAAVVPESGGLGAVAT